MRINGSHSITSSFFAPPLQGSGMTATVNPSESAYIKPAELASTRKGILAHGEHLTDLLLDIVPGADTNEFPGVDQHEAFVRKLIGDIESKRVTLINEKFDGSPSIVLGFDEAKKPFVAYKHGLGGKNGPRIIRNVKEANTVFRGSVMGDLFEDCIRFLRPRLLKFKEKDLVFQADLLFTPRNGAKTLLDDQVNIRANPSGITYTVSRDSRFFAPLSQAKVGLVVHTAGRRVKDPETGNESIEPLEDEALIEKLVSTLRSDDVFAIDPWSRNVGIDGGVDSFDGVKKSLIEGALEEIRRGMTSLGKEFRGEVKKFLPHLKIFLNASLKEGSDGGIYRAAAEGKDFDFEQLHGSFALWLKKRSETMHVNPQGVKTRFAPKKAPQDFEEFSAKYHGELSSFFKAYYDANRIQYILKPHMREVYSSKLGGGRIEGIMMTDGTTKLKVKLVDRLDFTMQNFAGEKDREISKNARRARRKADVKAVSRKVTPKVYRKWRGRVKEGAVFFIGKMQPPHAGHIAMIGAAISMFGLENVFVMPSDKAPNFLAESWREIGAGKHNTKKELEAGLYTHVFSPELRADILRYGLPEGAQICFSDTRNFWSYLKKAKDNERKGSVRLIVGEKEMEGGSYKDQTERFASHLKVVPIQMKAGGVSATDVRNAVKSLYKNGDEASYEYLSEAYSFISPAKERDRIIGRMVEEWRQLDAVVKELL